MNNWNKVISGRQLIKDLTTKGIVKTGHFKLTSGRHSDTYIHKDSIILDPYLREEVVKVMCKIICPGITPRTEVIVGPIMGALPFASIVAAKLQLPLVYPDKAENGLVILKRGFDKFIKNKTVFIVEDIVTTGTSFMDLSSVIDAYGGEPIGVACIWNRGSLTPNRSGNQYFSAIINKQIDSWDQDRHGNCPDCAKGIPLTDPKTNKAIA